MWLGFDLCLSSGSVRRLRGAGRVGSGVHGVVRPRRVRGGACGPAVGRWPHWESHTKGSTGVPGAYAACRLGSSGRTCRASACPMGTELAKEIQEIKRNWVPGSDNKNKENNQNDQNKDKDKKGKKGGRKKDVNEVDAEENTPTSTTDAP